MNSHFIFETKDWKAKVTCPKAQRKLMGFRTHHPTYTLWHLRKRQEQEGLLDLPLPFSPEASPKTLIEWAKRATQVVECLPSKHEALSSNPSTAPCQKNP
jgi:hypothetical protein